MKREQEKFRRVRKQSNKAYLQKNRKRAITQSCFCQVTIRKRTYSEARLLFFNISNSTFGVYDAGLGIS